MIEKVFVDSNVLVYAHDANEVVSLLEKTSSLSRSSSLKTFVFLCLCSKWRRVTSRPISYSGQSLDLAFPVVFGSLRLSSG